MSLSRLAALTGAHAPRLDPFRAPKPLLILIPSNFVIKNGFPVVQAFLHALEACYDRSSLLGGDKLCTASGGSSRLRNCSSYLTRLEVHLCFACLLLLACLCLLGCLLGCLFAWLFSLGCMILHAFACLLGCLLARVLACACDCLRVCLLACSLT